MESFRYHGFDNSGAQVSGEIAAADVEEAGKLLRQQGIFVKSLKPLAVNQTGFKLFSAKLNLKDLEFLTTELSVLLDAGLKIDKGLELLRQNNRKPALAELLDKLCKSVRSGRQFSQALRETDPILFDPLFVNLVSIGEATGQLSEVFRNLAADLAFKRDLQQKVTQALMYPLVICFVCIVSILFIFNYVVPNLAVMFEGREDLPVYTTLLLSASAWMTKYQWYLFVVVILGGIVGRQALQKPDVKQRFARWQLQIPLLKQGVHLVERIRFNSGLTMMLSAGVAIDTALELSAGNVRNPLLQRELLIALQKVKRGEKLSFALRQTALYPDFFASLLAVGEESGELGRIFREIAERSQREFSAWVTRLTSLLEPLLIIVMGGIVGGVVVIMMLSITATTNAGL